jgi:tetratricopeptide (TPR) repeat protein
MKKTIIVMMIGTILAGTGLAVDNPNVRNVRSPIGSPTAVPSAGRTGLVPSRPFDTVGRDSIVTGNVGGLAQFRGSVPYSSGYYYRSSSVSPVDDFLRRSYDPISSDRSPGRFRPYYDPRRTVTTTTPSGVGGSTVFSPLQASQGQADPYTPPMLAQTVGTQYRPRPLSLSAAELERILSRQMQLREDTDTARKTPSIDETAKPLERIDQSIFFKDYLLPEEVKEQKQLEEQAEQQQQQTEQEPKPEQRVRDQFIEELQEQLMEEQNERTAALLRTQPQLTVKEADDQTPTVGGRSTLDEEAEGPILTDEQQAEAAALLSKYKTFERLAEARSMQYLVAAERFLKEGKFYKAADAFELATVWTPTDARPYAGRAFALFAAGEYISSSRALRKAILLNENVATEKVDLAALIGDRDVFENRLLEMETWQQRSQSGDLAFLMAFVLYQDGQTQRAAEAIRKAIETLPDDKAVAVLQRVILPNEATQD